MGRKAQEVTHFAKQVMDECVRLQKQSGMTIKEFAKACGFGEVYWYTRANYSLPLNLSDLERISEVTGVPIGDIVMDSKRHAVEAAERKAQAGGYGLAAYDAAGKEAAETIEADNADYSKLIDEYNKLVDEYNSLSDDYDTATETIDKADGMKADIKKMEATRDNLQAQIESLTGQVDNAKRTSASDGVWQVGKDIDAGTYRANNSVTDRCYWEISVGDDIVQNDIPGGGYPQVTVSDGQQFKLQNCGTFTKQ